MSTGRLNPAQKVIITGASSGIGRALAVEYARRGAVLGLIARRVDVLEKLAAALPARSYSYQAAVRDAAALAHAARDFIFRAGCPEIVIANAGVSAPTRRKSRAERNDSALSAAGCRGRTRVR